MQLGLNISQPEFVIIWFGLAKAGVACSLVNTNVTGSSLKHALSSCNSGAVILHHSFNQPATQEGIGNLRTFIAGETWNDMEFSKYEETQVDPKYRESITNKDVLFYIYTSGTTGSIFLVKKK